MLSTTESRRAIHCCHSDQSPVDSSIRPYLSYDRTDFSSDPTQHFNTKARALSRSLVCPVGSARPGAMGPVISGSSISGQGAGVLYIKRPPILTYSHATIVPVAQRLMSHALCLMPHAPCSMPHAACLMHHASCHIPHAVPCPMPYALCLMPHAPCPMPHAPCLMPHAAGRFWPSSWHAWFDPGLLHSPLHCAALCPALRPPVVHCALLHGVSTTHGPLHAGMVSTAK